MVALALTALAGCVAAGVWGRTVMDDRGTLDAVRERHDALERALSAVSAAVPIDWRRGTVERDDLDRFAFAPEDVVAVARGGAVAAQPGPRRRRSPVRRSPRAAG